MDSSEKNYHTELATMLSIIIWTRVHCFLMIVFKIKDLNNSVNPCQNKSLGYQTWQKNV